jgi:membrane-associated phospholipid phosphatase
VRRAVILHHPSVAVLHSYDTELFILINNMSRRRRPFSDIVQVVVVGKRPSNWSFPSEHSATAFAGVRMLERRLPRWCGLWYTLASLVGFSRIYRGAHYPGNVVSSSLFGLVLAEATRWLMSQLGLAVSGWGRFS